MRRGCEIGCYNDNDCIGLLYKNFDALPPIFKSVDFGLIDKRGHIGITQPIQQPVDERTVPSRIRDERGERFRNAFRSNTFCGHRSPNLAHGMLDNPADEEFSSDGTASTVGWQ